MVTAHANPWHCQAALAVTQAAFCCGSVYLKSSLQQAEQSSGVVFHPIIYAFLREAIAAPIMIAIAWFTSGMTLAAVRLHAVFVSVISWPPCFESACMSSKVFDVDHQKPQSSLTPA